MIGFVVNPFQLGIATAGTGVGAAANIPLTPSLIADQYPIGVRTRMFAAQTFGRPAGQVIGPIVAGGVVAIAGNHAGDWRWPFWLFAIPATMLGVAFLLKKEPQRGRNEQLAVFGEDLPPHTVSDGPVRLTAAMARLKKVRTFYFLIVGIGVLGRACRGSRHLQPHAQRCVRIRRVEARLDHVDHLGRLTHRNSNRRSLWRTTLPQEPTIGLKAHGCRRIALWLLPHRRPAL